MFRAAYLLAADGIGSTVRNKVFGKNLVHYAAALEAKVNVPDQALQEFGNRVLFDLGGMPRGYGWIFPKRDHFNVGVYSIFGATGLKRHLTTFIARYGSLAGHDGVKYSGFAIPLRNVRNVFERDRVWLLGDAAGLADSVYGEGIYFALKSAQLAANAFRNAGFKPRPGDYSRLVRRALAPELKFSERIGRAFFSFQKFGFERIARSRQLSDYFAGLVLGTVGYRECFYKTLATTPYWLFSPKYEANAESYSAL
jgi:flavin-dependent dehydrogenase